MSEEEIIILLTSAIGEADGGEFTVIEAGCDAETVTCGWGAVKPSGATAGEDGAAMIARGGVS